MVEALTIVLADDDHDLRATVADFLRLRGHEVLEAEDGRNVVKLVNQHNTDLVITDILMPNKEGLATIMDIKRNEQDVKIIAISGGGRFNRMDFLATAPKLGADFALNKPFEVSKLEEAIDKVMNLGTQSAEYSI